LQPIKACFVADLEWMLDIKIYLHGTIVLRTIIQPCGGMGTEIKSGTEKTLILAGLTKLADIKGGELGMGTVLNNQRFTLIINNFRAICLEN